MTRLLPLAPLAAVLLTGCAPQQPLQEVMGTLSFGGMEYLIRERADHGWAVEYELESLDCREATEQSCMTVLRQRLNAQDQLDSLSN